MKLSGYSCYEVIEGVDQAIEESLPIDIPYFVLGGVATAALRHEGTFFDIRERIVYAQEESSEDTVRPNGTRRDIDILVGGLLSRAAGDRVKARVEEAVEGKLEVSVFGFKEHVPGYWSTERLKKRALSWTSERTIDQNGIHRYELFPLQQEVNPKSYEQWRLVTPRMEVGILNPVGHVLAYSMRSITGPRPKDSEKFNDIYQRVFSYEELAEQVDRGIYSSWRKFADAIISYRTGELPKYSSLLSVNERKIDRSIYKLKSNWLSLLESQQSIVKIAQYPLVQRVLSPFVKSA